MVIGDFSSLYYLKKGLVDFACKIALEFFREWQNGAWFRNSPKNDTHPLPNKH